MYYREMCPNTQSNEAYNTAKVSEEKDEDYVGMAKQQHPLPSSHATTDMLYEQI